MHERGILKTYMPPTRPPQQNTIPETRKPGTLTALHTMKGDMEEAVKHQNETVVSIALAEERKRALERTQKEALRAQQPAGTQEASGSRVNRFVVLFFLVAILAGIGYGGYVFWKRDRTTVPPMVTPPPPPPPIESQPVTPPPQKIISSLITAQTEQRLTVGVQTNQKIFSMIADERRLGLDEHSIKNISIEEEIKANPPQPITAADFFSRAGIQTPETLSRSLNNPFMIGFLGETGKVATPFIVLKVSDKNRGFAGMLALETKLPQLFDTVFGTTVVKDNPPKNKFHNATIQGVDTRILESSWGALGYVFVNSSTVIIAGSRNALDELIPLGQKR